MTTPIHEPTKSQQDQTGGMLDILGMPPHRYGYTHLCYIVPLFARDYRQSLAKDIYPAAASHFLYEDGRPIEQSIRDLIAYGWANRDPGVWNEYFPNQKKAPTNKHFIATLAKRLK